MAKSTLELFKSVEKSNVHGSTIINHKVRVKLKLTIDQYTLLDLIHKLMVSNKEFTYGRIQRWIGMKKTDQKPDYKGVDPHPDWDYIKECMKVLKAKGLYEHKMVKGEKQFIVTKRYQTIIQSETDDDFEFFWQKREPISWKGSKEEGRRLYHLAAAKFGTSYLNNQKEDYFEFLITENFRSVMNVTTFLNIDKQRFNEPWKEYTKDLLTNGKANPAQETANTIVSMDDYERKFD